MSESEGASQQGLVAILQSTHNNLRRAFHGVKGQEWEEVWRNHTSSESVLQSYSSAMHRLATEIWEPRHTTLKDDKTKSRLEWIRSNCQLYFDLPGLPSSQGSKLKTLDVGSCYNPLGAGKYRELFEVTALDLCPAPGCEDEVKVCDFLHVGLSKDGEVVEDENRIVSLPKDTFSVVVFSFFLEYLPDPKQRVESCRRAMELLKLGGLLFILRPDSNPANQTNSKQIKQLKVGCAIIGLRRVFCDKMQHFWGMAFAKVAEAELVEMVSSRRFKEDCRKINFQLDLDSKEMALDHLFAIPQDSRDWGSESEETQLRSAPEGGDPFLLGELPAIGSESDVRLSLTK